jgi:hypothetical protein
MLTLAVDWDDEVAEDRNNAFDASRLTTLSLGKGCIGWFNSKRGESSFAGGGNRKKLVEQ